MQRQSVDGGRASTVEFRTQQSVCFPRRFVGLPAADCGVLFLLSS